MRDFSNVKATKDNIRIMGAKINRRDGALCAILTTLEQQGLLDSTLRSVNWAGADACAGQSWVREWFQKHKASDAQRRADALRARAAARQSALAKLTQAERAALGVC